MPGRFGNRKQQTLVLDEEHPEVAARSHAPPKRFSYGRPRFPKRVGGDLTLFEGYIGYVGSIMGFDIG